MGKPNIIRPSTRAFIREARQVKGFSVFDLIHGYFYARWIYFYITLAVGDHPWVKRLAPLINWLQTIIVSNASKNKPAVHFEDTYHAKVVPLETAKQLISVKEDIHIGDLEHIIPFTRAREIVLKNPDHIVALDCPCRMVREQPCLPLDVCLIIGEPFASFMIEHHPQHTRWISAQEAEDILKAEDQRGHVHHAFFKDAMLERFYAICNCCSCCCGAIQTQRNGMKMLASSGYVAHVDEALCSGCGICVKNCIFSAIHIDGKAMIDTEQCMGCGICIAQCRRNAIRLERMESKGEPLEIKSLIEEALNK